MVLLTCLLSIEYLYMQDLISGILLIGVFGYTIYRLQKEDSV